MKKSDIIVIGAGFSGLSAACHLAKNGYSVTVLEKNSLPGGRARKFESDGFMFDMGPSWYWMPDVFERFFAGFGKRTGDYYKLVRLDPSYRIYWGKDEFSDLPADYQAYRNLFESYEKGSAARLDKFLQSAEYKYRVGINKLVYKKSASALEFIDPGLMAGILKLNVFTSFHSYVRKYFTDPRLLQMIEFPVLFLGGTPEKTPALYSLMNYGDIKLGTWYPMGGMYKVVEAMYELALSLGVEFVFNTEVEKMDVDGRAIRRVYAQDQVYEPLAVVGSADYHHIEQHLLPPGSRRYGEKYWKSRVMSPSSLIFYLGISKRLPRLLHHTLLFDEDFKRHASDIYDHPAWPVKPSVYFSATSKTDPSVAPQGMENLMALIPVATGLIDTEETRERYFGYVMQKLEQYTGESLMDSIVFKRSYAHNDFAADYHAFGGNAYGLANTLMQTAFLKPKMNSPKVKNLFYTGQLTVPGPGVPPAIISGQVAATEISKKIKPGRS
ncbi:MAG: phytoene desaturase [Bacteroidales bacterium]|nr:phytoene desaturase [Bacteroidales bacterium]